MRFIQVDGLCLNVAHIVSIEDTKRRRTVIRTISTTHVINTEYNDFMYQFLNFSTMHVQMKSEVCK